MDPTTILTQARTALEVVGRRNSELIRSLPDLDLAIPDSDWTVREAAIHLVNYAGGVYVGMASGEAAPFGSVAKDALAEENLRRISDIPEGDPHKVATLLTAAVEELLEATAGRSGDQPVVYPPPAAPNNLAGLVGIALGEQVLHGYDVARALRAPWPIDPAHALLVLYGYGAAFSEVVNPESAVGWSGAYGIELRGGQSFTGRFVDGRFSVEAPGGPVDATISADPVAFLLVGTRRMSQWEAIALGLFEVGGPKPELALSFMDLFLYP